MYQSAAMLKRLLIACLFLPAIALAPTVFAEAAVQATVADLAWMSGSWAGPVGEQTLEENWIHPVDGTIASLVRFTGNGTTSMIELIVIEETEGSLVLRVQQWFPGFVPRNAEPWLLELAELTERRVGFVSAGPGDFKSLTYSRPSDDSFNIDVETKDGGSFQINLHAQ
jgi:hypothetical protein